MKHIKIHSFTHLLHLLYCLILALPLCAVFGRTLYVQFNKNAYESYYGETINEVTFEQQNLADLKVGVKYKFLVSAPFTDYTDYRFDIVSANRKFIYNGVEKTADKLRFYISGPSTAQPIPYVFLLDSVNGSTDYVNLNTTNLEVEFELSSFDILIDSNNSIQNMFYQFTYNKYSYLDNAFEYSIYSFTKNSNIGRLNLVNWFTDVFLDSSNATNMLYLNFINWYMNYALLVSCVYILFLVLMWFVSLARRLIYKGMEI